MGSHAKFGNGHLVAPAYLVRTYSPSLTYASSSTRLSLLSSSLFSSIQLCPTPPISVAPWHRLKIVPRADSPMPSSASPAASPLGDDRAACQCFRLWSQAYWFPLARALPLSASSIYLPLFSCLYGSGTILTPIPSLVHRTVHSLFLRLPFALVSLPLRCPHLDI